MVGTSVTVKIYNSRNLSKALDSAANIGGTAIYNSRNLSKALDSFA